MALGDIKILESMQKFGIKGVSVEQMRGAIEHYLDNIDVSVERMRNAIEYYTDNIDGDVTDAWVTKTYSSATGETKEYPAFKVELKQIVSTPVVTLRKDADQEK